MLDLRSLYQEVIVDHNRQPRNFGRLPHPTHHAEGFNPLCGDAINLDLAIDNNTIDAISFDGHGCAISTASASLMTEILKGKTMQEAEKLFQLFHDALVNDHCDDIEALGKLQVLLGVKDYPARIKCATLAWHALHAALHHTQQPISTE
ncbi:MAG: SUF system NifU family Fe-S cluster assembly protein [Legionellales bacterium]|nr:SUF system NifU family Fe-S cluster assembly protein [Legionellales bacterium]